MFPKTKKNLEKMYYKLSSDNEALRQQNYKLRQEREQLMKAELTLIWYMDEYLQETDAFYLILPKSEQVNYTILKVRELEDKIYKQTKELIESEDKE